MGIPVLKLNLAPTTSPWRQHHRMLGWMVLGGGALALALVGGVTWRAYLQAAAQGRDTVTLTRRAALANQEEAQVLQRLGTFDNTKERPRWILAERIFRERSLPWSRVTAELERTLSQDVRLKSLQRTRSGNNQRVEIKLKGEAKTREAEVAFIEALQKNGFFDGVILERESERQGGGVDFELSLPASSEPPAFVPLPKFGPERKGPAAPPLPLAKPPKPVAPPPRPVAPAPKPVAPKPPVPSPPKPAPPTAATGLPTGVPPGSPGGMLPTAPPPGGTGRFPQQMPSPSNPSMLPGSRGSRLPEGRPMRPDARPDGGDR